MTGQNIGFGIPHKESLPSRLERISHQLQCLFNRPNAWLAAPATMIRTMSAIKYFPDFTLFFADML